MSLSQKRQQIQKTSAAIYNIQKTNFENAVEYVINKTGCKKFTVYTTEFDIILLQFMYELSKNYSVQFSQKYISYDSCAIIPTYNQNLDSLHKYLLFKKDEKNDGISFGTVIGNYVFKENIISSAFVSNYSEDDELWNIIFPLINKGRLIIGDLCAYSGVDTLQFANKSVVQSVISIENDAANFKALKQNVENAGLNYKINLAYGRFDEEWIVNLLQTNMPNLIYFVPFDNKVVEWIDNFKKWFKNSLEYIVVKVPLNYSLNITEMQRFEIKNFAIYFMNIVL